MSKRIGLIPLVVLLAVAAVGRTAEPTTSPNPNVERVTKHLAYLAGEECQGRGLETNGILKAGDYIANKFKSYGLKPAFENTYFQPFDVPAPSKMGTPQTLVLKKGDVKIEPTATEGFVGTVASANGKAKAGLVFAGYGITSTKPAYDDYAGLDVKGKMVVVLRRSPGASDPHGAFSENPSASELLTKIRIAEKNGAAGLIFVNDTGTADKTDLLLTADKTRGGQLNGPVLHAKRDVIDGLLKDKNTTLAAIEAGITKEMKPNSFELTGWEAETEVTVVKQKWPTRNVVAVCEGAGPLAGETVVIGAHYDHLGLGEPGGFDRERGKIHYGADDNASGTTGLLELARRYGEMKNRQGRRIVFVAFSGEEQGLYGSKHYCEKPAFPLDNTVFMLNMDMIGRVVAAEDKSPSGETVKKDRIVVYGTGTSTGLADRVQETNKKFDFKLLTIAGGSGPSDHTSFYDKGIPVLFFFTGTHKDYHRPSDTPDKINTVGLLKVADYVQAFADHYATVKEKPDFLKTKGGEEDPTDLTPRTGRRDGPRLGLMPGEYGDVGTGLLVGGVSKGGPAEKGGIKENDVIVEIGGVAVKEINSYMNALAAVKPGTEVEVVVKRDGKIVKLKVTPTK